MLGKPSSTELLPLALLVVLKRSLKSGVVEPARIPVLGRLRSRKFEKLV